MTMFDKFVSKIDDACNHAVNKSWEHKKHKVIETIMDFVGPRTNGYDRIDEEVELYSGRKFRVLVEPIN